MRIGDLRHRIALQSPTRTADGMGGFTLTWTDQAEVWAAIWPISATEQLQAGQQGMTTTHRIRLRYRSVSPSWRIAFGTRYFAIVSVINANEAKRQLDLLCRESA